MIVYLIKVTLIWTILLTLYELLYKKNPAFTSNRLYLLMALTAGTLLPLITWTFPMAAGKTTGLQQIARGFQSLDRMVAPAATPGIARDQGSDMSQILKWLYLSGTIVALLCSLREVVLIIRTAVYGVYTTVDGHRIFSSDKVHAPFSFMGWVFISDPGLYNKTGLAYILKHEDAHNRHRHWIDMILMQLFFIIFWFHPLVWRFRYLLKLSHEYEADRVAAGSNAYDYGHFLLQQVLLKGTPSIAHSFHFSPIKNRIHMLSNNPKKKDWKYLVALPALLCCCMLTAIVPKAAGKINRLKKNNVTLTGGNTIQWSETKYIYDTTVMVMDPATKETKYVVHRGFVDPIILSLNGEKVKSISIHDPSTGKKRVDYQGRKSFSAYLTQEFKKNLIKQPRNFANIQITNALIDKQGKLVYYEIVFGQQGKYMTMHLAQDEMALYEHMVDNILAGYDRFEVNPEDKGQNLFISTLGTITLDETVRDFRGLPVD